MLLQLTTQAFRKVATVFEAAAEEAGKPGVFRICANALSELSSTLPGYLARIDTAKPFVLEAVKTVLDVEAQGAKYSDLQSAAFKLLECMAVIARENELREGGAPILPAGADLMRYFEGCGEWNKGDGSLVCEYYYERIPAEAAP